MGLAAMPTGMPTGDWLTKVRERRLSETRSLPSPCGSAAVVRAWSG